METQKKVAILGASDNPNRFAYRALKLLLSHGHDVVGLSPRVSMIEGVRCYKDLAALMKSADKNIHTLTVYVNADLSSAMIEQILGLHPARIIFNPGAENPDLEEACRAQNIEVVENCTLVMLNTGRF